MGKHDVEWLMCGLNQWFLQVKRRSMRGRQDYSLPLTTTQGQMDLLRFMAAQDEKTGIRPTKRVRRVTNLTT